MHRDASSKKRRSALVSWAAIATVLAVTDPVAAQAVAPPASSQVPPAEPIAPPVVAPAPVYLPPGYGQPVYPPPAYAQPGYPPPAYYPPPSSYPPAYAPPGYAPPGYAPPGYAPQGYAVLPTAVTPMNPDNPPPGYHTESRSRSGFVVSGAVMFGIAYVLSATAAIAAESANDSGYGPLFIPVVGPFVAMGSTHTFQGTSDAAEQVGRVFGGIGLVVDGLLQVAGASLIVVGLAVRKDVVVRDRPVAVPEVGVGPGGMTARWSF
jgi:hypothetical protein